MNGSPHSIEFSIIFYLIPSCKASFNDDMGLV